jgi:hypothetical protein
VDDSTIQKVKMVAVWRKIAALILSADAERLKKESS